MSDNKDYLPTHERMFFQAQWRGETFASSQFFDLRDLEDVRLVELMAESMARRVSMGIVRKMREVYLDSKSRKKPSETTTPNQEPGVTH